MRDVQISFFDTKPYDRQSFEATNKDYGFHIKYFSDRLTRDTAALARGSQVVCAFVNDQITAGVVDTLLEQNIALIALRCAGYNNVDLEAVYRKIHLVRVPAYSPQAVAEHAMTLMLALNRKIHKAYYRIRDNNFSINGLLGFDMQGKTAGVIGTGKIGRALIRILKGFGMEVLAFDKYPAREFASQVGFTYVDLDRLYREADIISLHCPLTRDSYHMINTESIKEMKDEVMIINTSRGSLIDTTALIQALKHNRIGSAGLDVYEEESEYFFEDFSNSTLADDVLARLLTFNNVLITSHQGFFTREALANIARTTLENIRTFLAGEPLENEICYKCSENQCLKETLGKCF